MQHTNKSMQHEIWSMQQRNETMQQKKRLCHKSAASFKFSAGRANNRKKRLFCLEMRWEGGSGKGGEERERESAQAHAQVLRQLRFVALRFLLMRSLLRFSALSALSPWTLQFFVESQN
jgi:hypothetical protein